MIMIIICNLIAPAVQFSPLVGRSNLIALSYSPASRFCAAIPPPSQSKEPELTVP